MAWLTTPSVWNRRKPKLVRGSTAGAQTDYQLKLTIYKGVGTDTDTTVYLGTYVNDDFSDLRFTSSDETTLLPYYIESYISGTSAVVWIKIDSIPADPFSKTIYIYYDNPVASPGSNATTTLLNTATGGTITTNVQNNVHSFTSNGTFTPEKSTNVKALVVAGGAGGGVGGGGAGGLTYNTSFAVVGSIAYPVTIGTGGAGKAYVLGGQSNPGTNSSFSTISTTGGGAAGFQNVNGGNGGSGGGAGVSNVQYTGGTGVAGQGFAGANNTTINPFPTGGGGGASQVGVMGIGSNGGKGGDGISNNITGVTTFYAGGGGGCASQAPGNGGAGGLGGGGAGSNFGAVPGTNGTPNTGGGGGGGVPTLPQTSSSGGSGIVIISYVFRNFASPEPTFSTTSPEQIYTANLTVSSTPTGAEIWINNIDQMVTTTSWFILNPGTYTIMLTKSGYEDYIETITLSSNQNAIIQGNLISSTGSASFSSSPSGAQIWIDGSYTGFTTPNTITGLSPGNHIYQLRLSGYYDNPFPPDSFTITGGQTTIIPIITMILIIGAIDISSTPSNAEIWLAPTGSPLAYQGVTTRAIIGGLTPTIQYTYELRLIDYYPKSGTFTLIDGETITRSEILDLLPCPESLRYEGDVIYISATPKDGIGPYYVEFRKGGIAILGNDPLGRPYTIPAATENTLLTRTYVLTNEDIRTALSGIIDFSVLISDSCPTTPQTCTQFCTINIGCIAPICNFQVT